MLTFLKSKVQIIKKLNFTDILVGDIPQIDSVAFLESNGNACIFSTYAPFDFFPTISFI